MQSVVVALGALLVGLLVGFQGKGDSEAAGQRADRRVVELERKLHELEALLRAAENRVPSSPGGDAEAAPAPSREATGEPAAAPRKPDESLVAVAQTAASATLLDRLAIEYSDAYAAGAETFQGFMARSAERFLFKTYSDVLRELGRPGQIVRDAGGPTFHYKVVVPGREYDATLVIEFADGLVFEVHWL
ncbi:MAG: hypothetical protein ACT4PV_07550 [Planctomycetaceae bacterium]